jgi:hypothetical protein
MFAPDGIFIGTDATERWTVAEFKAYAKPHFDKGRGWTYTWSSGTSTCPPTIAMPRSMNCWTTRTLADAAAQGCCGACAVTGRSSNTI